MKRKMKWRITSLVMSCVMAVTMTQLPAVSVYAEQQETSGTAAEAPSNASYAESSLFMPAGEETEIAYGLVEGKTLQKVYFGKNSDNPQAWYIAGYDSNAEENKGLVLMCDPTQPLSSSIVFEDDWENNKNYDAGFGTYDPVLTGETPQVYPNHYGASDIRATLKELESNTSYFSSAEQALMQNTTVHTYDYKNNTTYSTTDKLYLATGDRDSDNYITVGTNKVDTSEGKAANMSVNNGLTIGITSNKDPKGQSGSPYASDNGCFGLRSPYGDSSDSALGASTGSYVLYINVNLEKALVPAFSMNLSSVLFASAAQAASPLNSSDSTAFRDGLIFRYDGSSSINSVAYRRTDGVYVDLSGDDSGKDIYLYVQGNDGTNDRGYSKQITEDQMVKADSIYSGCTDISDAKVWLEYVDDGIAYAKNAFVGVTGVSLNQNSINLAVNGEQTLTATVSPDNAIIKTVKWSSSDSNVAAVDESGKVTMIAPGTATITAISDDIYNENSTGATASCTVTSIHTVTYDANGYGAAPSAQSSVSYNTIVSAPDTPSEDNCTFKGWYKEASCVNQWDFSNDKIMADTTLYAGWIVNLAHESISASVSNTYTYTGSSIIPAASDIVLKDGDTVLTAGTDYTTEITDNTNAGTATVTFTGEGKYTGTKTATFTIGKASVVTATVTANSRTYDGTEKPLVTVTGEPTGGEMQYALGNATEVTQPYTTTIPAATKSGTYYVWYKVKADENHIDTIPKCVKAMIDGKYTVTFDLNGRSGEAPAAQSVEKNGKAEKPADPTADGFKFAGWYTDKNCTMGYNFDASVYSDITLYAKWIKAEKNTVKVVFNMQDYGIRIPEQIIESGKKPIQPDDPIDSTKVFGGWYTEPECKTLFDFKKAVTADTNIYAKWSDREVTGLTAYFADEDLEYNEGLGRYEIVYTGGKIQPSIVVTNNATDDKELTIGTDYTISYTNNLNVDKNGKPAVVTVKGTGNYSGSKRLLFYILPKSLGSGTDATPAADITLSNILVQSGSKVSPVICYKGYKLANKDFTVTSKTGSLKFTDADEVGNRKVTITGKGNFSGCIKDATVTVSSKKELADKTINVSLANTASIIYDGKPQVLKEGTQLKVTAGGKSLSGNYIVSYTDNINAGTAKVTVTGVNGYTGSVTRSFRIAPDKSISTVTAQAQAKTTYDVNGAKPKVSVSTVRDDNKVILAEGIDYTVTYSSNKKVTDKTKAKYTVKFIGNYRGRKNMTGTFEIEPAVFNPDVKAVNLYYTKPGKYMSEPYVSIGGVLLTKKDYTVRYYVGETDITDKSYTLTGDSANVKVVITGKGNYAATVATVENCYTIRKAPENATDLSRIRVTMKGNIKKSIPAQQYTDKPVVPEFDIWVKVGNDWKNITESGLVKDTDYEVTILNNKNKGNATILISAKNGSNKAKNSKAVKFKIVQKKLTGADQILKQ